MRSTRDSGRADGPCCRTTVDHYDVSRDGKRFLFMTPVDDDRSAPFTVVVNWPHIMSR
jgi:hypothetical protein